MEINFAPEDIEKYVKDALIKSSIGTAVYKAVEEVLKIDRYDSVLKKQLEMVVRDIATSMVRERFTQGIKERIAAQLELMVTDKMMDNLTSIAVDRMIDAARGDD